jgi:N-acetylglucosamine malate deacetylase 1
MHVLLIGAHPDDEIACAGTLALFRRRGDRVKIVSVTSGNKGHFAEEYIRDPRLLVERRAREAAASAAVIGAEWATMGINDGEVYVTQEATEAMVRLLRSFGPPGHGPDLVLLNRPSDYHRDHRYSAQLVLDATYMLTVPPMCPDTPHLSRMPVFAYWHDGFTEHGAFRADVVVPIDSVVEERIAMYCAHESQFNEWIPYNGGYLDRVPTDPTALRAFHADRVKRHAAWERDMVADRLPAGSNCRYAEAFQISEYGTRPDAETLAQMFPVTPLGL